MAFVGLVPSEHSSGTKQARGAITKTGNAHLRRVLVEAAWHYRHRPFVGRRPAASATGRAGGHHRAGVDRAAALASSLSPTRRRAGNRHQQVITAVARELTGFVWAALIQ